MECRGSESDKGGESSKSGESNQSCEGGWSGKGNQDVEVMASVKAAGGWEL